MLQGQVLIREGAAEHRLATRPVATTEVAALDHEATDDAVEDRVAVR